MINHPFLGRTENSGASLPTGYTMNPDATTPQPSAGGAKNEKAAGADHMKDFARLAGR